MQTASAMQPVKSGNPSLSSRATRTGDGKPKPGMAGRVGKRLANGSTLYKLGTAQPGGRSLDASKAEAAYVGYHKTFVNRLMNATPIARRLATFVETDNLVDRQVWLTKTPKMRRWVGDKVLHKLRTESHPIVTQPHEASVEIPKKDIQNDKLGLYMPAINSMADAYGWALDEMVIVALAAGVQGIALGATYDGQNLIDTDHTALSGGGTAQSNKVTGALSATTYNLAWTRFLGIVDENGVPVNVAGRRMKLVVGPANREVARDIIDQQAQANGETNMDRGTADLIVTPWLTARTVVVNGVSVTLTGLEWFLIPEDSSAIIVHVKQTPIFLSVEEGEFTFRTGLYLYGIEAEFGFAYGLWQEIVGGPGV
jgi:phage major head subunit gpT-like protein